MCFFASATDSLGIVPKKIVVKVFLSAELGRLYNCHGETFHKYFENLFYALRMMFEVSMVAITNNAHIQTFDFRISLSELPRSNTGDSQVCQFVLMGTWKASTMSIVQHKPCENLARPNFPFRNYTVWYWW